LNKGHKEKKNEKQPQQSQKQIFTQSF